MSYADFLAQLREITKQQAPDKETKATSVYEQLCFDFPIVSYDDLQVLKTTLKKAVDNYYDNSKELRGFPITHSFVKGIVYGATKHVHAYQQAEQEPHSTFQGYSEICALVFVKLFRLYLSLGIEELDALLADYQVPKEESESLEVHVQQGSLDEERIATVLDDDDYVYEAYDDTATVETDSNTKHHEHVPCTWAQLELKLLDIASHASYISLCYHQMWEELEIPLEIADIIRFIRSHQHLKLLDMVPSFAFLLRDKMLNKPESIRANLPLCLGVLNLGKLQTAEDSRLCVAIFGALASHARLPDSARRELYTVVGQHLKFLDDKLAVLSEADKGEDIINEFKAIIATINFYVQYAVSKNNFTVETQTTLIASGCFRDLVTLFVKLAVQEEMQDLRSLLVFLCSNSEKMIRYAEQVPPFMELLAEPSFQQKYSAETCIWGLILTEYPPTPVSNPLGASWFTLARDILQESLVPQNNDSMWDQTFFLSGHILSLLRMLLNLKKGIMRSKPKSIVFSKDSEVLHIVGEFQKHVKELKSSLGSSKESNAPSESEKVEVTEKWKKKSDKKHSAMAVQLLDVLKSLLVDESGQAKKD